MFHESFSKQTKATGRGERVPNHILPAVQNSSNGKNKAIGFVHGYVHGLKGLVKELDDKKSVDPCWLCSEDWMHGVLSKKG